MTRFNISKKRFAEVEIPLPAPVIQREVAEILRKMETLEGELRVVLEAELKARARQYAYYRDSLLTFAGRDDVQWATLGDVSLRVSSGATPTAGRLQYYEGGTIPWLRTSEVRFMDIHDTEMRITDRALAETAAKWIPENCVIIAISGATAGRCAINKIPLTTNQHCCNMHIDPAQANYRYVFHWVSRYYHEIKAMGQGARSDLNSGLIRGFGIALPSLDEQERIVAILDSFDTLVKDLSVGLPAEITVRRQQYEFYRDRLLTFEGRAA